MLFEYLKIYIFFLIVTILAIIIFIIGNAFTTKRPSIEKTSPYECGFAPFDDSRNKFNIKFYLVALLFIIFDLETIFLFPWAITLSKQGFQGYWNLVIFLLILLVGFIYEWTKGALDW